METFNPTPGMYLPTSSSPELVSPVIQDYKNSGAFIQSEQDFADSVSMPGDTITELINKVHDYQNQSRDILSTPHQEPSVGPGYNFSLNSSISKFASKVNPATPTLKASAAPMMLGSKEDYDRYAQSEDFQTFGYVPSLGKEQEYRYGRNMTWGDTMGKALAGGGALAWDTFIEGWKGWGRMAEALFTWDASKLMGSEEERYQMAQKQQEIFNKYAIYNTEESEDSLLNRQFFGNMLQQAGFAIGAAGQMILESYLTAGLGKAISAAVGGMAPAKGLKWATNASELIDNVRKAEKVITNSSRITSALREIATKTVPLFGTVDDLMKLRKAGAGTLQLGMLGVGGIKRELSIFNMARSEAIFEAAGTYKDLEDKLVRDFVSQNGRDPDQTELEQIRNTADRASIDNFNTNLGILMVMNRVQFGNMFKNFNTTRKIFNEGAAAFGDDAFEVVGKVQGKTVKKVYEKGFIGRFGAMGDIAKTFGKKKAAWEATKSIGKGLMKFEGSEGAQELLQEASNKGLSDYYYDLYSGKKGFGDKVDRVLSSIQNPITDIDGAKTFLMGALTGRLIAPFSYAFGKANFSQEAKDRNARKREAIGIINAFHADPATYVKEQIANVKVQNRAAETMEEAAKNHDHYTFYNAKDSAFAKAVASAIKLNMYDSLKNTIKELGQDLNEQEFKEAFKIEDTQENRKNVSEFMGSIVSQMDDYYTLYNNLMDTYGDRIIPDLYKYNTPEEYERVKNAKIAQAQAIEMLTTNVFKARQAAKRASKLQQEIAANQNIGASSIEILTKLGSEQSIRDHINYLKREISLANQAEGLSPDQRALLKLKEKELELAEAWQDVYEDVMTHMGESYFPDGVVRKTYKTFENLINFYNKAEGKNTAVTTKDIEENFTKFLDYIQLNRDNKVYIDAMNLLADPYNMKLIIESTMSSIEEMGKRMQEEHLAEVNSIPVKGEVQEAPVVETKINQEPAAENTDAASQLNDSALNQATDTARTEPVATSTQSSNPVQENTTPTGTQPEFEEAEEDVVSPATEEALKKAYAKYEADMKNAGQDMANYPQWKRFSKIAQDIIKKGEGATSTEPVKEEQPQTYADTFDVSSINKEDVSTDTVDDILGSSTESEKKDNFDNDVDDFFSDLNTCNL